MLMIRNVHAPAEQDAEEDERFKIVSTESSQTWGICWSMSVFVLIDTV